MAYYPPAGRQFNPALHQYHHVWRLREPPYTEHIQGLGWVRGGHQVRNVQPKYAFIWPKDGKRGNTWGRWRDILSCQGPDIHLSISGDSRTRHLDRPTKSRWSEWTDFDTLWDVYNDNSIEPMPWARRSIDKKYDFRKRKFRRPDGGAWTDVRWWNPPNDRYAYPRGLRNVYGEDLQCF